MQATHSKEQRQGSPELALKDECMGGWLQGCIKKGRGGGGQGGGQQGRKDQGAEREQASRSIMQ